MSDAQDEIDTLLANAESVSAETEQAAEGDDAPQAAPETQDAEATDDRAGQAEDETTQRVLGIQVPLSVVLARRSMRLQELMRITLGSIIEFDKAFDEELELVAYNRCIAFGQAVKTGENFGIRVTRTADVRTRIDALGPGD